MSSLLYKLVRAIGLRPMMNQQIALVMECVIEFVGEMQSFILELGFFFVIWYVLDLLVNTLFVRK